MKVVFLRANPIDPDPRVEKELNALLKAGIDCICVGWDRSEDHKTKTLIKDFGAGSVHVNLIGIRSPFGAGAKNLFRTLCFEKRVLSWLIKHKREYDIVHSCDLDTGLAAKAACLRTKKPYVYDIFDFFSDSRIMPKWLKKVAKTAEFSVIKSSRATIICTEQRTSQIEGSAPVELIVIENTPAEVHIPERNDRWENTIRLAYVGILMEGRYIDRILDTVDEYGDLAIDVGGFGPLALEVEQRAKGNPRIRYLGKVPYETALETQKNSDVMFGLYDPSSINHKLAAPNKYYESLMLGVPLIAIKGTSVGDWVEEENTGISLEPGFTSSELHQALVNLANANQNGEISQRQFRLYHEKHSWSIMERRLQELYSRIATELQGGAVR